MKCVELFLRMSGADRGCDGAQRKAMSNALAASPSIRVAKDWEKWVAVRDCCLVGRDFRYSDAQIRYHYAPNNDFLRDFIASKSESSTDTLTSSSSPVVDKVNVA